MKFYCSIYRAFKSKQKREKHSRRSLSIRSHIKDTGHIASIDNFCILDNVCNELDLLIQENLLILRDRPTLNQQNSSIPLCLF